MIQEDFFLKIISITNMRHISLIQPPELKTTKLSRLLL